MASRSESQFRQALAIGFLAEASQDLGLGRWRSCVDSSQLAVENAAKAVLALIGPVGRTHIPAMLLRRALDDGRYPSTVTGHVHDLIDLAEILGSDLHVQSDYGDESTGRTPWEIFDERDARRCQQWATQALALATDVLATIEPM